MSAYAFAKERFLDTLSREGMSACLAHGALVALSGGKDSVLLLALFAEYAKEREIPFYALHLNHAIRGAEADSDEAFCRTLCDTLGVPLTVLHADIPALAEESGKGIEETARQERYRLLTRTAKELSLPAILTAHTATDLAETVLLQILRGGGTRALCGIPPVRPLEGGVTVLRPLLSLSAEDVVAALADKGLSYVTDSTNADTAYARNYVRHEVLPRLSRLTPSPERAFSRMTENVREDAVLLDTMAKEHFDRLFDGESLDAEGLLALHSALRFRVLYLFYAARMPECPLPEQSHVRALGTLAGAEDRSLSMPGGILLAKRGGRLFLGDAEEFHHPYTPIRRGCNRLADGSVLWLLDESSTPLPEIIYTLSTQRALTSATIDGELYVRSREAGDAYRYGNMTHKLKKMLSDQKIPRHLRSRIPVLCDGRGIVWVPPFGVRDDGARGATKAVAVYLTAENITPEIAACLPTELNE